MPDLKLQFTEVRKQKLMASQFNFTRCGQSGIDISDGFPTDWAARRTTCPPMWS
jgi:hypothetical protein